MTKNYIMSVALHISQTIYHMIVTCGDNISRCFFSMLKFWFSRLSRGWKGKKWPKILKISICCTLHFRNHISYDLRLWYTCMYKRIISPGIFFIFFKILVFGTIRGEIKGQKMAQNDKKIVFFSLRVSGTIHHMIVIFGAHV